MMQPAPDRKLLQGHSHPQVRDPSPQLRPESEVVLSTKTTPTINAHLPSSQPLTHSRSSGAPRDLRPSRSPSLPPKSRRPERPHLSPLPSTRLSDQQYLQHSAHAAAPPGYA